MKNIIQVNTEWEGRFKFETFKAYQDENGDPILDDNGEVIEIPGSRKLKQDWSNNLILDAGLNRMGDTTSAWVNYCHVGTDNTVPTVSDTGLGGWVASKTFTTSAYSAKGSAPYYGYKNYSYRFGQGVAAGNLSEVSVGWSATNDSMYSRALIVDGAGDPTTITVLSDEYLDVFYELRCYPPDDLLTPRAGSITIFESTNGAVTGDLTDIAFVNSNPDTITRVSGSFITDGFVAGDSIYVFGSAANSGYWTIASGGVSALTLTLDEEIVTAETAGPTVNIATVLPVTYTTSTLASQVTSTIRWGYSIGSNAVKASNLAARGDSWGNGATLGGITGNPSGGSADLPGSDGDTGTWAYIDGGYTAGTWDTLGRSWRWTWGLTQGGFTDGMAAFELTSSIGSVQFSVSPSIPKTTTDIFTLDVRHTWGRRVIT